MSDSVKFENVTKKYKMYNNPKDRIKDIILPSGVGEDFFALQNVSFTAKKGDVIGVIGVNGAGKSTLSNLIAGITPETEGKIKLNGQASLIAINSGLDNQLTGRENIELKCLMLGFSKKKIKELMPKIEDFADIGKFVDQQVKKYSSGMKSRLGFAISINIDPDILVIDEALSVGDKTFANKCLDKMNEFKEKGKTIFFISHSIGQVKKFCEKAMWLEAGMIRDYGTIGDVIPKYEKFLKEYKAMSKSEKAEFKKKINERRSTLQVPRAVPKDDGVPLSNTRIKKRNNKVKIKRILIVLLSLFILGIGCFVLFESGLFSKPLLNSNHNNSNAIEHQKNSNGESSRDDNAVDTKEKMVDIRFVNVKSAYIHENHDLDSIATFIATFANPYKVVKTYKDNEKNIEWLNVENLINKGESGWINSNLLTSTIDAVTTKKVIYNLNKRFDINLGGSIKMLGESVDNTRMVEDNYTTNGGIITSITLQVKPVSLETIRDELGKPFLKLKYALLYIDEHYYYSFSGGKNGNIKAITIGTRNGDSN